MAIDKLLAGLASVGAAFVSVKLNNYGHVHWHEHRGFCQL